MLRRATDRARCRPTSGRALEGIAGRQRKRLAVIIDSQQLCTPFYAIFEVGQQSLVGKV